MAAVGTASICSSSVFRSNYTHYILKPCMEGSRHPVLWADSAGVLELKASLAFCKGRQVALGSLSYLFYEFGFVYQHAIMLMSHLPSCEDQVRPGTFVGELSHNEIRNAKKQSF